MVTYSTPGVYFQEIPTLAPSVAQVATAIPVFIGYTEKGPQVPTRIDTLLDYESLFGKANPSAFTIATATDQTTQATHIGAITRTDAGANPFIMYYGLSLYFRNGGGSCYIISLGNYSATPAKADFTAGLALLEKEDEPTLVVLLDAVNLPATDYYDLCVQALTQCQKLGDRFLIADIPGGDAPAFRNKIGTGNLGYGAAYHPYLQTTLNYQYQEDQVLQSGATSQTVTYQWSSGDKGITASYTGTNADTPKLQIISTDPIAGKAEFDTKTPGVLSIKVSATTAPAGSDVADAWTAWKSKNPAQTGNFDIQRNGDGSTTITAISDTALTKKTSTNNSATTALAALKTENTALYNQIKTALNDQRVILPPSPAIAGIYASVDRDRGVWKAPANVSVNSVIGPVNKISDGEQEGLNIDPTAGKSINAIRSFTGKGTLVWGARTLLGNDNEWRYIPVRRLFITIEESTRKATQFAVFEPNDASTWLKVKAMIESYLYGLWQQGALAGAKPEAAYFVNIGLGKTMTPQDILEGRMNVDIGVAAVRPAEFIVLRFSHKMQEA